MPPGVGTTRGRRFAGLAVLVAAAAVAGEPPPSGDVAELDKLQQAFRRVTESVTPCVVGIRAQRRYQTPLGRDANGVGGARTFEQLVAINGSGTIIDPDGLILTNEHVVQNAEDIRVLFHDGRSSSATVFASDARSDLAILAVNRKNLTAARFCDWSSVARGQWAIVLGNPYGLGQDGKLSVSIGVISNLDRRLPGLGEADDRLYSDMIQTTAAINPGNSGGPMFNIHGELIGVVTAMHTRAAADEGVGFAIPLTPGRRAIIEKLKRGTTIEYGYIGLTTRDVEGGVRVEEVEPSGPAARADVRVGDVLTKFNGQPVHDASQLVEWVGATPVGQTVTLEARRGGQPLLVTVDVERRNVNRIAWMRGGAVLWRGLRLAELTPESRERMQVDSAVERGLVVIDVAKGSPASRAAIQIGDIIERADDTFVADAMAFRSAVRVKDGAVTLRVRGKGDVTIQP